MQSYKGDIRDFIIEYNTGAAFGEISRQGGFGTLIIDPPWEYNHTNEHASQGGVNSQYGTMTQTELCNLDIKSLCKPNALVFIWGTWPKFMQVAEVTSAWGLEHVTGMPWIKVDGNGNFRHGPGRWAGGASEYVLICRYGQVSPPGNKKTGMIVSTVGDHSGKPGHVHEFAEWLIDSSLGKFPPTGPCLELFARQARSGWYVVGNEVDDIGGKALEINGKKYTQKMILI